MIYRVDERTVKTELKKLRSLNYNRFFWWRKYTPKKKPLSKNAPLWDRILNGDFEFSHYYWQSKQAEIEINELHEKYKYDDRLFIEKAALVRARRRKLIDDFKKDEEERLKNLKKEFLKNFFITEEEYEKEINEFGYSIKEFYIQCESKFGKRFRIKERRGRPKKKI